MQHDPAGKKNAGDGDEPGQDAEPPFGGKGVDHEKEEGDVFDLMGVDVVDGVGPVQGNGDPEDAPEEESGKRPGEGRAESVIAFAAAEQKEHHRDGKIEADLVQGGELREGVQKYLHAREKKDALLQDRLVRPALYPTGGLPAFHLAGLCFGHL